MIDTALQAVVEACAVARAVQRDLAAAGKLTKEDRSPVTVADFAVQAVVALALREADGGTRIVGEEHAGVLRRPEHEAVRDAVVEAVRLARPDATTDAVLAAIDDCDHDATAPVFWTLDPVDGTKGFLRGQQYAVALARVEDGRVTHGVMGCPNLPVDLDRPFDEPDPRGALYAAAAGGGSWQWPADAPDEAPRRVAAGDGAGGRLRLCESVEAAHSRHDDTARVVQHLGVEVDYARLDSQCKYAVVARGQADAYLRMPTRRDYVEKIWDHAAGALLATEAGAVVTDVTGAPLDFSRGPRLTENRGVLCAVPEAHAAILAAIGALGLAPVV